MYSDEEIQRLISYINSVEKRIKEAKRIVCENTIDFNVWYKYSAPEERYKYPSMLGINTLIGKLINDKMTWLKNKEYIGMVIDLDYLLEAMENLYLEGSLSRKEINNIKREIINLNFGSVINLW